MQAQYRRFESETTLPIMAFWINVSCCYLSESHFFFRCKARNIYSLDWLYFNITLAFLCLALVSVYCFFFFRCGSMWYTTAAPSVYTVLLSWENKLSVARWIVMGRREEKQRFTDLPQYVFHRFFCFFGSCGFHFRHWIELRQLEEDEDKVLCLWVTTKMFLAFSLINKAKCF